jgi:hypothetical protein
MKIVLIIITIFSCSLNAYEVQGKLENLTENNIVKEADTFSAKLVLWPYEAEDEESFYELEGKDFLDFFFVSRVSKVQRSVNNNLALEVYLTLVLKKFFIVESFYIFTHKDINIPVEIVNIKPERRQLKTMEFFVRDEKKVSGDARYLLYTAPLVLLLLGIILLFIKKMKKEDVGEEPYVIKRIDKREEFEKIYQDRDRLLANYPDKETRIKKLLTQINNIQYKPNWSEEELGHIKNQYESVFFENRESE